MLTVFLLVILLSCSCSTVVPCSGPVTYNTTDFTIRGPCPNDVVIAPVGDTVQYRCDYEDRRAGLYLPYWHIAVLSGSPFISGETNDHELVVYFSTDGYTTIDIPVQQQYLNHTLIIQCGLCILALCSSNPLSENILSSTVGLVTFSTPSSLNQVLLADTLSLSWSPPSVSVNYTDPIDFQYEVTLINVMNTSQVLQLTTNNTHLNISQLLVPDDHDICSRYWWSVSAIVKERRSKAVQSNVMVLIPTVPFILSGSIRTNITECSESVLMISVDFKVISCPDAGDLRHSLSLEVDADRTINSNSSSELLLRSIFVVKSTFIILNLDGVFNSTITVTVSNMFGSETTSYELVEDTVNVYNTCDEDVTPSTTTVISSDTVSSSVISRSNDNHHTSALSTSPSVLVIVTQPRAPSTSNSDSDIIYISIAVGLVVALLLVAVIIIICVIIGLKLYKRKSVPITPNEKKPNSTSNGSNINFKLHFKLVSNMYHNVESSAVTPVSSTPNDMNGSQLLRSVEDCPSYATPLEIKETLTDRRSEVRMSRVSRPNSYANSQSVSTDITDTQGYTEPASTVPRVEEALYSTVTPSTSRTTTPTHLLVDTPGYSQPLVKKPRSIRKSKVVSTPRTSMSSLPVTPAHDSETPRSPQTLIKHQFT